MVLDEVSSSGASSTASGGEAHIIARTGGGPARHTNVIGIISGLGSVSRTSSDAGTSLLVLLGSVVTWWAGHTSFAAGGSCGGAGSQTPFCASWITLFALFGG